MSLCTHSFTWTTNSTGASTPPDFYVTHCAACGTYATWNDGSWKVGTESAGSLAMDRADRFGDALQEILAVMGPTGKSCSENKCEGCQWEMEETVRLIKVAVGLESPDA